MESSGGLGGHGRDMAASSSNASHRSSTLEDGAASPPSTASDPTARSSPTPGEKGEAHADPYDYSKFEEDDPDNPMTFPTWRKWYCTGVVSICCMTVTCASSIYSQAYRDIESIYGVSETVAILGLSLFVLGLAIGPLFLAPTSEVAGRRPVLWVSYLLFVLFNVPTAVPNSLATIMISRFLAGLFGASYLTVAGGTVSDLFAPKDIALPLQLFLMAPFVAPALGPLVGGAFIVRTTWHWLFYFQIIWGGVMLFLLLFLPETYHPTLLRHKVVRLRKETGDDRYHSIHLEKQINTIPTFFNAVAFSCKTPFKLLSQESIVFLLCSWTALLLSLVYLYFEVVPLIFEDLYDFNPLEIGLVFVALMLGIASALLTYPLFQIWTKRLIARNGGVPKPEFKLVQSIVGGPACFLGFIWFTFTTYRSVPWPAPVFANILFGWGIILVFISVNSYLVAAYTSVSASALAANMFTRGILAAATPLFAVQMYQGLTYQGAGGLLAGILLLMSPLGIFFFIYGERIRTSSKNAQT